jgi:hypothetical protein
LCRHITTLLEDVVFFVIGKESTGGLQRPDPLTEEGMIIRERQKLLREQYVLKEIFNMLSIPIKHGGELGLIEHRYIHGTKELCPILRGIIIFIIYLSSVHIFIGYTCTV